MKQIFIYALYETSEPESVRYVGYSVDPQRRLQEHFRDIRYDETHKAYWLRKVRSEGGEIEILILEECTDENCQERERYWIARMREEGHPLTNLSDGGDGFVGLSPEAQEKRVQNTVASNKARTGEKRSDETRRQMSESHKGVPKTEEHNLASGAALKAVWDGYTDEEREARNKTLSDWHNDEEKHQRWLTAIRAGHKRRSQIAHALHAVDDLVDDMIDQTHAYIEE